MYLDNIVEGYSKRLIAFVSVVLLIFSALLIFLWRVQLKGGEEHRQKISKQSFRKMRISPVRGRIITEDNMIVADSKPAFDAVFHISEMRQPGKRINTIEYVSKKVIEAAAILGRRADAVNKKNLDRIFYDSLQLDNSMFSNFWKKREIERSEMFPNMSKNQVWEKISEDCFFANDFTEETLEKIPIYRRFFAKLNKAHAVSDRLYQHIASSSQKEQFIQSWQNIIDIRQGQVDEIKSRYDQENLTESDQIILNYLLKRQEKETVTFKEELLLKNIFEDNKVDLPKPILNLNDLLTKKAEGKLKEEEEIVLEKILERKQEIEYDNAVLVQAQKITSIPADDLSKAMIWKKLRQSWRWKRYGILPRLSPNDLIQIIGQSYTELIQITISNHISQTAAIPYKAFKDLDFKSLGAISEAMHTIPGLEIQINCQRDYIEPTFAAHLLGTTSSPTSQDYKKEKFFNLPPLKGRSGLEYTYDEELRGKPGQKVVQVDTSGYSHDVKKYVKAKNGDEIILNINSKAQLAAQKALENMFKREERFGAIAVIDIHTGAVKAMASYPTFNLKEFDYTELNENEDEPLLNRAMSERYTPGSIVKPLVGLAALQTGAIEPDFTHICTGRHYVNPEKLKGETKCWSWKSGGHGELDLFGAIEQSCNPYFNEVGIKTTFAKLRPFFVQAGFGSKTGIDVKQSPMVLGEASGHLPTRESYKNDTRSSWSALTTAQFAMGQSDQGVTPLQAVCYTAALANGGTVYKPRLVKEIRTIDGELVRTIEPEVKSHLNADSLFFDLVKQGMHQVVWGDHASAPIARISPIPLAGKTGTAEVGPRKHTWFTCFGPENEPKYACTVLVINGRSGGKSAAPVATEFFQRWLGNEEN